MFLAALFTIAKTWKQAKCPSKDEWIKMYCVYMCVCVCVCVDTMYIDKLVNITENKQL